jgi:pyruvate, orthophosphate dikinase
MTRALSQPDSEIRSYVHNFYPLCVSMPNTFLQPAVVDSSMARRCGVRADASTAKSARAARCADADGIGLCRTESLFLPEDRLAYLQSVLLSTAATDRMRILETLKPAQQAAFAALLRVMSPLPVTFRLLDPPLNTVLPSIEELDLALADAMSDENWDHAVAMRAARQQMQILAESNPTMGHRGCRVSLTFPEILRMQVAAILGAALDVANEGFSPNVQIMVPLVSSEEEIRIVGEMIHETAAEVLAGHEQTVHFSIGAMIELPRAALCAVQIASHVGFVSFGTNDLTQMTYGFSREDVHTYLAQYLRRGVLKSDPFATIDRQGVGLLMELAVRNIRHAYPAVEIGVCGEHATDPESVRFFQSIGVNYVCCSPDAIAEVRRILAMGEAG